MCAYIYVRGLASSASNMVCFHVLVRCIMFSDAGVSVMCDVISGTMLILTYFQLWCECLILKCFMFGVNDYCANSQTCNLVMTDVFFKKQGFYLCLDKIKCSDKQTIVISLMKVSRHSRDASEVGLMLVDNWMKRASYQDLPKLGMQTNFKSLPGHISTKWIIFHPYIDDIYFSILHFLLISVV